VLVTPGDTILSAPKSGHTFWNAGDESRAASRDHCPGGVFEHSSPSSLRSEAIASADPGASWAPSFRTVRSRDGSPELPRPSSALSTEISPGESALPDGRMNGLLVEAKSSAGRHRRASVCGLFCPDAGKDYGSGMSGASSRPRQRCGARLLSAGGRCGIGGPDSRVGPLCA